MINYQDRIKLYEAQCKIWALKNKLEEEHNQVSNSNFNKSGSKYLRPVPCMVDNQVDVYAVLDAFAVWCPARQHAIKKLLCAGNRFKNTEIDDLREAKDAIDRAIQMALAK